MVGYKCPRQPSDKVVNNILKINNHENINQLKVFSLIKLSCALQENINNIAVNSLNGSIIDQNHIKHTETLINRLKHQIKQMA